ncbi:MAG: hypothetical protein ACM30I_02345 [Gemmatimonas sp.]
MATSQTSTTAGHAKAPPSAGGELLTALVPALFWFLPLIWAAVYLLPPVNFDVSLVLSVSQRWLEGERLYVDLIDVNPPLIFVINLIPAAISKVTGFPAPQTLILCILALIGACVWLSVKILPAALYNGDGTVRMILPPLILFALVIFPGEMFGQREHLMLATLFPYTLLAAARAANRPVPPGRRVAVAVLAAIGFALKPHFLAVPALIELFVLSQRGFRVWIRGLVPWTMAIFQIAYALAAWFGTPEYFNTVLPLVVSAYSKVGGATPMTVILGNQLGPALLIMIPLGIAAYLARVPALIRMLFLAGIGAAASGVLQDKGWPYHLLPAFALSFVIAGAMVASALDRLVAQGGRDPHGPPPPAARAVIGAVLLTFIAVTINIRNTFYDQWGFSQSPSGQLLAAIKPVAEGVPVLILSPGVYPHWPMLNYAHDKLALRFQTIWPLQGAYEDCGPDDPRYHSRRQMPEAERVFDQAVVEDLVKYKPPVVIIDKVPGIKYCGGRDFDLIEYFVRQPGFAEEFEKYDLLMQLDRYIIYKRRPEGETAPDE